MCIQLPLTHPFRNYQRLVVITPEYEVVIPVFRTEPEFDKGLVCTECLETKVVEKQGTISVVTNLRVHEKHIYHNAVLTPIADV